MRSGASCEEYNTISIILKFNNFTLVRSFYVTAIYPFPGYCCYHQQCSLVVLASIAIFHPRLIVLSQIECSSSKIYC